jgi:hypothetical protein
MFVVTNTITALLNHGMEYGRCVPGFFSVVLVIGVQSSNKVAEKIVVMETAYLNKK